MRTPVPVISRVEVQQRRLRRLSKKRLLLRENLGWRRREGAFEGPDCPDDPLQCVSGGFSFRRLG